MSRQLAMALQQSRRAKESVDDWMRKHRLTGRPCDIETTEAALSPWRQAQLRVSVHCGRAGHPRRVLSARSLARLDKAEQRWRCPACGAPDAWGFTRRAGA
jgi:hypothetical protein